MTMDDADVIHLTLPQAFTSSDAAELRNRLKQFMPVGQPRFVIRKAVDPTLGEQVIQLIGSAPAWAALWSGAAVFFGAVLKRAGDDTYETIKSFLKRPEATPFVEVGKALEAAVERAGPTAEIIVGVDTPEGNGPLY